MKLGRETCGHWNEAVQREWLVTNGLGGYACGTVAGANSRRYHAFLMASFEPPSKRKLLVAKVDLTVEYRGRRHALSANEFSGSTVDPTGFVHLESFEVRDGLPVWRYALADALLEQTVFMAPGANTSYLGLSVLRAGAPLRVELKPLVTYRDYHSQSRGAQPFKALPGPDHCTVEAFEGARPYRLAMRGANYAAADLWYWNFLHREEFGRGLDALEDLWGPGLFSADLAVGQPLFFTATADADEPAAGADVLAVIQARSQRLVEALPTSAPPWVRALAIASDQFIVQRGAPGAGVNTVGQRTGRASGPAGAASMSVIAGYPWFADWGRDTMISLPGLTTVLGRFDVSAAILKTYAGFVDRGMLPNRFPDAGDTLEYNTADATLWLFQAVSEHLEAKRDAALLRALFPVLAAIIHAHVDGTRHGIKVDPADGLLRAGEAGLQLTWMDAKHGNEVFTPRIGKPVEINALWLNALAVMVRLAGRQRNTAEKRFCQGLLDRASAGFSRFWNAEQACLFDVLDVPGDAVPGTAVPDPGMPGTAAPPARAPSTDMPHTALLRAGAHDASIRPNQLFAVSLPYCVLPPDQMRAVVDRCARDLLTSYGLRSLSVDHPAYRGHYTGNSLERDAAYHQGTVWGWLLGPFARAHHRVYGDAALAQSFLAPMAEHLGAACLGTLGEVFDGDAPHTARGCFAQAWSVAEILRSWIELERKIANP